MDFFDGQSLNCIVNVAAAQLEACPGAWSTAALRVNRQSFAATSLPNQGLAIFAGGSGSNVVEIFNASSGRWSTAALSVARGSLAATSLPNQGLAIFAGGNNFNIGFVMVSLRVDCLACGVCYVGTKGCGGVSNACWVEGGL